MISIPQPVARKIKQNLKIYKKDLEVKGLRLSVLHRLYKLPLGKQILTPTEKFLKPGSIVINNNKVFIDRNDPIVSQTLLVTKKWEKSEMEVFKKLLKKGNTVLDIGAHIGLFTLLAAQTVGPEGKVYSFEPDPKNFSLLKKNVSENNYQNVALINKAVSDKTAQEKLFLNPKNSGDHRLFASKEARKSVSIKTIKLDDIFKGKQKIDLIKMDIQGSEYLALQGALKLIKRSKNLKILMEFSPQLLKLGNTSAEKLLELLEKQNFKFYEIKGKQKMRKISSKKLLKLYPATKKEFTNLLCKR